LFPQYTTASDPEYESLERPEGEGDDMSVTVDGKKRGTKKRKLEKMLEDISKAASGVEAVSKKELADAVIEKARARAARNGTTVEKEESALWREIYSRPQPQMDYDGHVLKYETPKRGTTKAEIALDGLAKTIMKRDGTSFAQSYNQALKERPELYAQYVKEYNEGATFEVPEPVEYKTSGFLSRAEQDAIAKRRAAKNDPGGNSLRLRDRPQDDLDDEDGEEDDLDDGDDEDDERLKRHRATKADPSGLRCSACSTLNDGDADYCKRCASKLD
jgi:hypothetical protein